MPQSVQCLYLPYVYKTDMRYSTNKQKAVLIVSAGNARELSRHTTTQKSEMYSTICLDGQRFAFCYSFIVPVRAGTRTERRFTIILRVFCYISGSVRRTVVSAFCPSNLAVVFVLLSSARENVLAVIGSVVIASLQPL